MTTTTTFRQKDGAWQIIVSYKDGSGRWKQKSKQGFAKKSDAKEYEATLLQQIKKQPRPIDRSLEGITLHDFTKEYIRNRNNITPNTARTYIVAVNSLNALRLKAVNTITFLDLQNAVRQWKMKPGTQSLYKAKLNVLFKAAIRPYRIISANPMEDIVTAKDRTKRSVTTVTEQQYKEILADVTDPEVRMAVIIAWFTGMRKAEIVALDWENVSIKESCITVARQYVLSGKKMALTETLKSHNGYRTVPIPQDLVKELKAYRATMPIRLDGRLFADGHLLYARIGRAMKQHRVRSHWFRHTYATRLLAKGIDVQTVAALIGDDVKTVINTYIHYTDEMRKAAAQNIEKVFAENF